jgi:hypothetical protein
MIGPINAATGTELTPFGETSRTRRGTPWMESAHVVHLSVSIA